MNNPSYANLGGSGQRATKPLSATGTFAATNKITFATNPFASGDANSRIAVLNWGSDVNVTALITTVNTPGGSGYIVVSNINWAGQGSGNLPTSGSVTVTSGGSYLIDIALSSVSMGGGSAYDLLNGDFQGNINTGTTYFASSSVGGTITFDFGAVVGINLAKMITEITFNAQNVPTHPQGTWAVEASADNSTWDLLNASVTLSAPASQLQAIPLAPAGGTWTKGYRWYRFRLLSGTVDGYPYIYQFTFKIDDFVATASVVPQRAVMQSQSDLITYASIEEISGFGKNLGSLPAGIVFADAFDNGLWTTVTGTPAWDYSAVRTGTKSLAITTAASAGRVTRTLSAPINLANTELLLSYYLKTADAGSNNWANPVYNILVAESVGALNAGNYVQLGTQTDTLSPKTNAPYWPLRLNCATGPDTNSLGAGQVVGTVNLANINFIDIRIQDAAGGGNNITLVLDSLLIVKGRTSAQLSMRHDCNDVNITTAFLNYINALGLNISIQFGIDISNATSGLVNALLAQQANGHRCFTYAPTWSSQAADVDVPLSRYSRAGLFRYCKNAMQGLGFMPYVTGFHASGSGEAFNPDLWAAMEADLAGHTSGLAGNGAIGATFCNDQIMCGNDATDSGSQSSEIANIAAAVGCRGRYVLFSHLGTYASLAYWIGSTAAIAASNANGGDTPPNGVTGIFDPAGTLVTALKAGTARWLSWDQMRNVSVSASGGGGQLGIGL